MQIAEGLVALHAAGIIHREYLDFTCSFLLADNDRRSEDAKHPGDIRR